MLSEGSIMLSELQRGPYHALVGPYHALRGSYHDLRASEGSLPCSHRSLPCSQRVLDLPCFQRSPQAGGNPLTDPSESMIGSSESMLGPSKSMADTSEHDKTI